MFVNNLIVIKGGAYSDIKKAQEQWVELYSTNLQPGFTFQLFRNGRGSHIIQADARLDNENFYYLVNYLSYPEGIEYKASIKGYTTGNDENELKAKQLLVYISPTDKEYDNVFVTTSDNEHYKVDFGGRIIKINEQPIFDLPVDLSFDDPETIVVSKQQHPEKDPVNNTDKLAKRFKAVSAIIIGAFLLNYLFFKHNEKFLTFNIMIVFGAWGWLFFDYKMLQVNKLYFAAATIGLTIFLYGYWLKNEFIDENKSSFLETASAMPVVFLVLQKPLRLLFKRIMKREPVVEKPAPSFADFVYIFILWMSTLLIPIVYFEK